jgi:hypothetical protein
VGSYWPLASFAAQCRRGRKRSIADRRLRQMRFDVNDPERTCSTCRNYFRAARKRASKRSANALMAATVSPVNEEPCIRASIFGLRLASPRMEGAVVGPRLVSAKKSSASIAGSTMSVEVNAGPSPNRVKRSPQKSVWVVSLKNHPSIPSMRHMGREIHETA